MGFEQYKENALKSFKQAKSKGLVDEDIKNYLTEFNQSEDYYTTSSCSGRILLLKNPDNDDKMPGAFYYKTHKPVGSDVVINEVKEYDDDYELWFKLEPFILHVGCRELRHARQLLGLCREEGIKRAGINAWSNRIIVEVIGTARMESLVYKNKLLVDDEYLKTITSKANQRLKRSKNRLYEFFERSKNLIN